MKDNWIISGCLKEDRECQKQLVVKYSPSLLSVARRYTSDFEAAKDVLQDAFIRIFKHIKTFDSTKGNLSTWMTRVVINVALKRLDKKRFKLEHSGLENIKTIPFNPNVYSKLNSEDLMNLVNQLPHGYKQVFNLYAIEGYAHKEIAEMLGIAESGSRSNYSRARKILITKIQEIQKSESWVKIG